MTTGVHRLNELERLLDEVDERAGDAPPNGRLTHGVLAAWAAFWLSAGSIFMVGHWVVMPEPDNDSARLRAGLSSVGDGQSWTGLHVLYEGCQCSRRVVDHLLAMGSTPGVHDLVLVVGDGSIFGEELAASSLDVRYLRPEALRDDWGIEAAPLFVAATPEGEPVFIGGYTERKQGWEIRDREILATLLSGGSPDDLPLYGCGVSKRLQGYLDPLGIKYE